MSGVLPTRPSAATTSSLFGGGVRVAIYARVSSSRQETDNQVRELEAWAGRRFLSVYKVYREVVPGWEPDRQQIKALLHDAHERRFDMVIVWSLDRFSRGGIHATLDLLRTLGRTGVVLESYKEPYISQIQGAVGELMIAFMAFVARQEHSRLSERTLAGLERAREKGRELGRPRKHDAVWVHSEEIIKDRRGGLSWGRLLQKYELDRSALSSVRRVCLAAGLPKGPAHGPLEPGSENCPVSKSTVLTRDP